ncbi:MAG: type II toxin-antitoxin system HicB family antitoxin [Alphaproteobacteria bacterium]|nr:type II toxin-antitoxin system HicB family antitoxin [Alphaproteobacteria bacterium]
MRTFTYPALLAPDASGGFVVTFPDLPDAITQGDDRAEAFVNAAECLATALAERVRNGEAIPAPSGIIGGLVAIAPDATTAAKAALHLAFKAAGIAMREFARRLGVDAKEAQRLLDPYSPSKMPRLEEALALLGQRVELAVSDNPGPAVRAQPKIVRLKTRQAPRTVQHVKLVPRLAATGRFTTRKAAAARRPAAKRKG